MATLAPDGVPAPLALGARAESYRDFDDLYAASFQRLTLQLYAYLGDLGEAQDVVQEAFCRGLARWESVRRYDDPVAWVRRVAWNLGTSRFRRQRTAISFLGRQREQHVPGPEPDRVVLTRALAKLPPTHRRVVVMHYLAQMPVAEIAAETGTAEGTVKSWLSRGREALATELADTRKGNL